MMVGATRCPCGTGKPCAQCCGLYIGGGAVPETPEQLMRSRYTAFVQGDADYLLATWHPSTRPARLELEPGIRWLGLKILRTAAGGSVGAEGFVEFVARYRVGGTSARCPVKRRRAPGPMPRGSAFSRVRAP